VSLSRLQVTDFRCLQSAELHPDPHFTLISGPNASGKTSLLEAIYVLGRGRSFRTRRLEHLIRNGAERCVVFGEVETSTRRVPMGVEGSRTGIRALAEGKALAHYDLRADNIILTEDRVVFIDWAHPALAPRWTDTVILHADMRGSVALPPLPDHLVD